jgi:hypothetical protein
MKLTEFLKNFTIQGGMQQDNKDLQYLLSNPTLNEIELTDEMTTSIQNAYFKQAKINPEIKTHFIAQTLNGHDSHVHSITDGFEFDDEVKSTIKNEKNSYKKVELLVNSLKNLYEQKASANTKGDKAEIQKQIEAMTSKITEMQTAIATKEKEKQDAIAQLTSQFNGERLNDKLNSILSGIEYADSPFPKDVVVSNALTLLQKELTAKGGKFKFDNGNVVLVNANDESLPFQDTKTFQTIEPQQFINGVISQYKLNKVTDPNAARNNAANKGNNQFNQQPNNTSASAAAEANRIALEAFQANS